MRANFDSFCGYLLNFRHYAVEFSLFLVACVLLYNLLKSKSSKKLPPGPSGLPFVGYLPFLGKRPHLTFWKLSKKYGKIISVPVGKNRMVVLNDYETMKETLCHPMALDTAPQILQILPQSGFAGKSGEEWEEQRRFCMHSMRDLGLGRGQWEKNIQEEIPDFLKKLSSLEGKPADIDPYLHRTVSGNILSLLMGKKLEEGKDDRALELIYQFSNSVIRYTRAVGLSSSVPGLPKLLQFFNIGGLDRAVNTIKNFSRFVTKDAIKRHKGEEFAGVGDFINIYLEKMQTKKAHGDKHYFSEGNAEGNLNVLFLGGSDTILASLGWLFRLMAGHPDIQRKVQEELDDVIGRDGTISFEDKVKIPYTFSVLMETQRFSSIVPLSPPRRAHEDFEVRGYTIPKGTNIGANLAAIHHDPEYWEEPDKFKPERFQSEDGTKIRTNLPSFVPFSIGRRNCPGETVAWMEILIFFTSVMQKFSIKLPPGDVINYEYTTGIVNHLEPQKLCFVERN